MYVPGSTALAGHRVPQELLIGTYVPGSTSRSWGARAYFVCSSGALTSPRAVYVTAGSNSLSGVGDNVHYRADIRRAFCTAHTAPARRHTHSQEALADHLNLNI
jgi:hypothetical protein